MSADALRQEIEFLTAEQLAEACDDGNALPGRRAVAARAYRAQLAAKPAFSAFHWPDHVIDTVARAAIASAEGAR